MWQTNAMAIERIKEILLKGGYEGNEPVSEVNDFLDEVAGTNTDGSWFTSQADYEEFIKH